MKRAIQLALVAAFLTLVAGNVKADPILLSYTLTGPDTASFELPEFPVVADSLSQFGFTVDPINLVVNGTPTTEQLFFYSATPFFLGVPIPGPAGGLAGVIFPSLSGDQLYTGDESAPQMLAGIFSLTDFNTQTESYTLTVTPVSTPESSTLVLFGTGLIALAFMRKRRMATANFTA
jgi:hypothetical protein